MLVFAGALVIMFGVIMLVCGFVVWAIHEHSVARKYRHLVAIAARMPPAQAPINKVGVNQWKVTYKVKGGTETAIATGDTEALALREFIKVHNIAYGKIVSSVKF